MVLRSHVYNRILSGMQPRLTHKRAAAFAVRISPMLGFVGRCRRQLEKLGFTEKSAIFRAVDKAYCAMQSLHVELRYASCESGVRRPRGQDPGPTSATDQAPLPPNRPDA